MAQSYHVLTESATTPHTPHSDSPPPLSLMPPRNHFWSAFARSLQDRVDFRRDGIWGLGFAGILIKFFEGSQYLII